MARDKEIVTKTMKRVKSKDTSIEVVLRKALWEKGFRYHKNYARSEEHTSELQSR